MALTSDIKMRGSGELLHQIKARNLSGQDVLVFSNLIWAANCNGEASTAGLPSYSIERLTALRLIAKINKSACMLNPHVAQIGKTPVERGQLRKRFRLLVEG